VEYCILNVHDSPNDKVSPSRQPLLIPHWRPYAPPRSPAPPPRAADTPPAAPPILPPRHTTAWADSACPRSRYSRDPVPSSFENSATPPAAGDTLLILGLPLTCRRIVQPSFPCVDAPLPPKHVPPSLCREATRRFTCGKPHGHRQLTQPPGGP
jgi:hypothetical protein